MILLDLVTKSFQFWVSTNWFVAFLMSLAVNLFTYFSVAYFLYFITSYLTRRGAGGFLDQRPLYEGQIRNEIKYSIAACVLFSIASLLTRFLYNSIWPESVLSLVIQLLAFTVFYESYSYFVHRLLHLKIFRSVHFIHHRSVRVTPWSAYCVHPVEAAFIAFSAPIFMVLFPMSLSVILTFHIIGMAFTMLIHSNFSLNRTNVISKLVNTYTSGHALHHHKGSVNYGFVSPLWDMLFKTNHSVERT